MENNNTELAILSNQAQGVATQITTIQTDMKRISDENKSFAEKIIVMGQELMEKVESDGMSDDLDALIAEYIKSVKQVTKAMSDNRKGVTQAIDLVKKYFTTIENEVSVKNTESIPYKLQQKRDEYARYKIEEERKREAERQRLAAIAAAKVKLASDVKNECYRLLASAQSSAIGYLNNLFSCVSLATQANDKDVLEHFPTSVDFTDNIKNYVCKESVLTDNIEIRQIINAAYNEVKEEIIDSYTTTIKQTKDDLLLKWDSKIAELEAAKKAEEERQRLIREAEEARKKAEEAERKAREAKEEEERAMAQAEAARLAEERAKAQAEQERIAREEAERKAAMEEADRIAKEEAERKLREEAEIRQQQQAINDAQAQAAALFDGMDEQAVVKAKVKKVIKVTGRRGWIEILNFWWAHKAQSMPIEEIEKKLGFAKKECEKLANKEELFINSSYIIYDDDITAK